jgi:oligoendopeptidase F
VYAEASVLGQQYGMISGKMTVEVGGQEYTLQQASKFLESPDRAIREERLPQDPGPGEVRTRIR